MISEILHSGEYNYKGKIVLKYELNTPHMEDSICALRFNRHNSDLIDGILKNINESLLQNSIKQHNVFEKQNVFTPIRVTSSLDVMLNTKDYISLFMDVHYDNGAEGVSTVRNSQTWNIQTGRMEPLENLFVSNKWRQILIRELYECILKLEQEMGVNCYPEWRRCLQESLDNDKYYLTAEGIVIFVPQGKIASAIWGVPTFIIEYKKLGNILNIY